MSNIAKIFCERFSNKDSEAFLELFTDDAIYVDSLYGEYKGKEAIRAFHKRCHEEAEDYDFRPKEIISEGDKVAFEWELRFILLTPFAKGKRIIVSGCSFINLKAGKIASYREYSDSVFILLEGNVPDDKIIKFFRKKYRL